MSADGFAAPPEGRFPLAEPYSGGEIATAIRDLHDLSAAYLAELSDEDFRRPQGAHWSPGDHVRHLRRSCRPVATALAAPKLVLRLRFGRPDRDSKDLRGVVAAYHGALAAGGSADGTRFSPPPVAVEGSVEAWRRGLIDRWSSAVSDLCRATDRWSERDLDGTQLPHPLLGMMTVREILLFTLYHNAHHIRRVAERGA